MKAALMSVLTRRRPSISDFYWRRNYEEERDLVDAKHRMEQVERRMEHVERRSDAARDAVQRAIVVAGKINGSISR